MFQSVLRPLCALPFAALMLAALPAVAADSDFAACDGYGAPSVAQDGMTATVVSIDSLRHDFGKGDTTRAETFVGSDGVKACDAALSDPHLLETYWMRRASLLRARALHRIAAGETGRALADLDAAEAVGAEHTNLYFKRSVGFGISMVRALALRVRGDQAAATELALTTWRQRPYSTSAGRSALVAMGTSAAPEARIEVSRGLAAIDPSTIDDPLQQALTERRFADAVALYPILSAPRPGFGGEIGTPAWYEGIADSHRLQVVFRASRAGEYAYALAALGRGDEAKAALETARVAVENATRLVPDETMAKARLSAPLYAAANAAAPRARADGYALLDGWSALVSARLAKASPSSAPAGAPAWVLVDLGAPPPSSVTASPLVVRNPVSLLDIGERREIQAQVLFALLPDAETTFRVHSINLESVLRAHIGEDAQAMAAAHGDAYVTVRSFTAEGTEANAQELALLKAAERARATKSRRFAVMATSEESIRDTVYQVGSHGEKYTTGDQSPSRYMTLDVLMTEAGAAAGQPDWRLLDPEAIYDAMGSAYGWRRQH